MSQSKLRPRLKNRYSFYVAGGRREAELNLLIKKDGPRNRPTQSVDTKTKKSIGRLKNWNFKKFGSFPKDNLIKESET
jgi:hypothetical protein